MSLLLVLDIVNIVQRFYFCVAQPPRASARGTTVTSSIRTRRIGHAIRSKAASRDAAAKSGRP